MKTETLEDCRIAARATGLSWEEIAEAFAIDWELPELKAAAGVIATGPISEETALSVENELLGAGRDIVVAAAKRGGELTREAVAQLFEAGDAKQNLLAASINAPARMVSLTDSELVALRLALVSRGDSAPFLSADYDVTCIELDACVREIVNRLPEPAQP